MLLQYIVSNFKSVGRSVEFTMIPSKDVDEKYVTILNTNSGQFKVLKRGALFGPNASGKSTLIESINYAKNYVIDPPKSRKGTGVNQFKGDFWELAKKSTFQFVFFLDNEIYEYGFSVTPKKVSDEWLTIYNGEGFKPLFIRQTDGDGKTDIQINPGFVEPNSKEEKLVDILRESIKENQQNQLFLNKLSENGVSKAESIIGWFDNIRVIFPHSKIQGLPIRVKNDKEFKTFLSTCLKNLDTGVVSISAATKEIDFQEFAKKLALPQDMIEEIESHESGIFTFDSKYYIFFEKNEKTVLVRLKFEHNLNNTSVHFNIDEESDGTKRLLDLLPILYNMEKESNTMYFVDEIDRSLHTKLTKFILRSFLNKTSDLHSQIVFTAHDVNLIDLNDFDKEEIWFIEKNNLGETLLKPFSDFETSSNQNIVKDYLNGRFGAIPVIRGE